MMMKTTKHSSISALLVFSFCLISTDAFAWVYSDKTLIGFDPIQVSSESLIMGESYQVKIPWRRTGENLTQDFRTQLQLVDEYGRVRAETIEKTGAPSKTSPETWIQTIELTLPPEDTFDGQTQMSEPVIYDGPHSILISVLDEENDFLLLDNADFGIGLPGNRYLAREIYVTSSPFEINKIEIASGQVLEPAKINGLLAAHFNDTYYHKTILERWPSYDLIASVHSETGKILFEAVQQVAFSKEQNQSQPFSFEWPAEVGGKHTLELRLQHHSTLVTSAEVPLTITLPGKNQPFITRENKTEKAGNGFVTPLTFHFDPALDGPKHIRVYAEGRLVGEEQGNGSEIHVQAEPWFGRYRVAANFENYSWESGILATVIETEGMDILVNGEPFIVKGLNVHGLDGGSRERTENIIRILKDLGFNTLRGDHPSVWQLRLAYKHRMGYMVLGPFSCKNTEEIYPRCKDAAPLTVARAVEQKFTELYREEEGNLLWNSCNEVVGETVDFLISMEAVIRAHDPYRRPVLYANLYGQDRTEGQQIMGVNYYFGRPQRAASRQPLILRSIEIARKADMPVIYTETNSYYGASQVTAVEAVEEIFQFGIDNGMSGGTIYMLGNSSSHPGVISKGFDTYHIYADALRNCFADAEIMVDSRTDQEISLRIRNKRRCTLRDLQLHATIRGERVEVTNPENLSDLQPLQETIVKLRIPESVGKQDMVVEGALEFVTHYGFTNRVDF